MKLKTLLLIPAAFLLTSCAQPHKHLTYSYITTNSAPVPTLNKNAQAQLAEAAATVGRSLQQMEAIQMAIHPKAKLHPPLNPQLIGMGQQTSINWTGPIKPLLQRIAKASHYKLRVLGNPPSIPVVVAINESNVPLASILRNATYQVEQKANITLYPATKTIELRYYPS